MKAYLDGKKQYATYSLDSISPKEQEEGGELAGRYMVVVSPVIFVTSLKVF